MTYDEFVEKVFELIPQAEYVRVDDYNGVYWSDKIRHESFSAFLGNHSFDIKPSESLRKRKWVPKDGDTCYYPILYKEMYSNTVFNSMHPYDDFKLKNGLCFRTKEEAIECSKKMLELWKSSLR